MELIEQLEHSVKSVASTVEELARGGNPYSDDIEYEDFEDDDFGEDDCEAEEFSPRQIFEDSILDVDFVCNRFMEIRSSIVTMTCGGPRVWIDTADSAVKGTWGHEHFEWGISDRASDFVDDVARGFVQ